jgi:hypothetical protein
MLARASITASAGSSGEPRQPGQFLRRCGGDHRRLDRQHRGGCRDSPSCYLGRARFHLACSGARQAAGALPQEATVVMGLS